jgi:murein DD-endopeptidase MepM/ murein hydrolase activator NlpD
MIRSLFILKRKFYLLTCAAFKSCLKLIIATYELVFSKRQILFITNRKIRTINLSPLLQILIIVGISWIVSLFYSSIQYNKILSQRSEEISRLQAITSYYETEFDNLNEKLDNVSSYMSSVIAIEDKDKDQVQENHSLKLPKAIKTIKISNSEQIVISKLELSTQKMSKITSLTNQRLSKIEGILLTAGLKIKNSDLKIAKSLSFDKEKTLAQGGPYMPLKNFSAIEMALKNLSDFKIIDSVKFSSKIKRLISLEKLIKFIPLARPIQQEYISSGFGPRIDPLTKKMAMHQGIDFVGSKNQKIISPSLGKITKAGKFYDYGNIVEINHGYGIISRYGHLSEVLVKKGQIVKKGDILGLQGSTGRSTGEHLHYEVRHRNITLNPNKFIKAGDYFFKNNRIEAILNIEAVN